MSESETVTISSPGHEPVTMSGKQFSKLANRLQIGNREHAILRQCADASLDLLAHHWDKISDIRDGNEDASVVIAVTFNVDCSGAQPKIVTKLSYAQKFKDEREDVLADDAQPGLGLEGDKGEP